MYQSIIADYRSSKSFSKLNNFINKTIENDLSDNGTFWILCKNSIKKKEMIFNAFNISESFNKYYLKNIILFQSDNILRKNIYFRDHFDHILFFSKKDNFFLNKDPIREKHIWKNVEWGKRAKNYNPKGKDPGNFWMKTEDDGKANITKHLPLNFNQSIERIIKCSSIKNQNICIVNIPIGESFERNLFNESI
tara:strand:+ start:118 stop:696 length:579 start_codon:yes stop_codon:yes gene_type:complete